MLWIWIWKRHIDPFKLVSFHLKLCVGKCLQTVDTYETIWKQCREVHCFSIKSITFLLSKYVYNKISQSYSLPRKMWILKKRSFRQCLVVSCLSKKCLPKMRLGGAFSTLLMKEWFLQFLFTFPWTGSPSIIKFNSINKTWKM